MQCVFFMFVCTFKAQRQLTTTLCQHCFNVFFMTRFVHFADFLAIFCNSILLFTSPLYATRCLCFQENIRKMCIVLLTAGEKWNIKVKY